MSAQPSILCVTKDLGSLAVVGPIAKAAKEAGMNVTFIAEEASLPKVEERFGITPLDGSDDAFVGNLVKVLYYDARDARDLRPDVIVVGCSDPINMEQRFAMLAESDRAPLVIASDIRGAWKRLIELNGLVLTTDETDADEARMNGFDAEAVGMHQANLPPASAETENLIEEYHKAGLKVILYASSGQPRRVAQELDCVLACSAMTSVRHILVFQANPKILPQAHPEGGTWGEWFDRRVAGNAVKLAGPFVRYADATISPSSGGLTALAAGRVGIGLRCAEVEEILASEAGVLDQLTFYEDELGMPIIRHPVDLAPFLDASPPKVDVKPFDAQLALKHIKAYAGIA